MKGLLNSFFVKRDQHPLARFLKSPVPATRQFWHYATEVLDDTLAQDLSVLPGAGRLSLLGNSFLLGQNINDFASEFRSGISEVVRWPLYFYGAYAAAGSTQIILFGTAAGNATNGYGDTNMQQAGMMAGGEAHVVMSIRLKLIQAVADAFQSAAIAPAMREAYQALETGGSSSGVTGCWLEFRIGDKLYTQAGPLSLFPSGFGLGPIFSSTATSSVQSASVPQNGSPDNTALWKQDPPTLILPSRTFNVTLNWKNVAPLTTAGKIGVTLDGYRIRAIQ